MDRTCDEGQKEQMGTGRVSLELLCHRDLRIWRFPVLSGALAAPRFPTLTGSCWKDSALWKGAT